MEKLKKHLDIAANISLIVCCILFVMFLANNYFFSSNKQSSNDANKSLTLKGKQLTLDTDWSANEQTLLLVLKKGCRFCDESSKFYQKLASEVSGNDKTRLIAVLPSSISESRDYLDEKKIEIHNVRQFNSNEIGVSGTPTLLLVNNTGIVTDEWIGKLPLDKESEVIARLK